MMTHPLPVLPVHLQKLLQTKMDNLIVSVSACLSYLGHLGVEVGKKFRRHYLKKNLKTVLQETLRRPILLRRCGNRE